MKIPIDNELIRQAELSATGATIHNVKSNIAQYIMYAKRGEVEFMKIYERTLRRGLPEGLKEER